MLISSPDSTLPGSSTAGGGGSVNLGGGGGGYGDGDTRSDRSPLSSSISTGGGGGDDGSAGGGDKGSGCGEGNISRSDRMSDPGTADTEGRTALKNAAAMGRSAAARSRLCPREVREGREVTPASPRRSSRSRMRRLWLSSAGGRVDCATPVMRIAAADQKVIADMGTGPSDRSSSSTPLPSLDAPSLFGRRWREKKKGGQL